MYLTKFRVFDKESKTMHNVKIMDYDANEALLEDEFDGAWADLEDSRYVVSESIGIKDKNGLDIFVGDNIKFYNPYYMLTPDETTEYFEEIVRYEDGRLLPRVARYDIRTFSPEWLEVLGNIYTGC